MTSNPNLQSQSRLHFQYRLQFRYPYTHTHTHAQHRLGHPSRNHLHPPARPLLPSVPDETGGQDRQGPGGQVFVEHQFLVVRHRGECSAAVLPKWILRVGYGRVDVSW